MSSIVVYIHSPRWSAKVLFVRKYGGLRAVRATSVLAEWMRKNAVRTLKDLVREVRNEGEGWELFFPKDERD